VGKVLLILIVWVLEVTIVLLFLQGDVLERAMETERGYVTGYLGEATSNEIKQQSDATYIKYIKSSGVEESVYDFFIPVKNSKTGLEEMSPWLFEWMEERLDTFWWAVYQFIYKFNLFVSWLPYLLPLLAAALVDGFMVRERKKFESGYSSPLRYDYALMSLYFLLFVPLLYITTPVAVHPLWVPIWGVLLCSANIVLSSNIQQRI